MLLCMEDHFGASEQTLIVNYHLLEQLCLFFEFCKLFVLLLSLFFQCNDTIMNFFISVQKISITNQTFNLLLRAFPQVKLQIKRVEILLRAFQWAWKPNRFTFHPHMLYILIICIWALTAWALLTFLELDRLKEILNEPDVFSLSKFDPTRRAGILALLLPFHQAKLTH